jgi:hypothetical protein
MYEALQFLSASVSFSDTELPKFNYSVIWRLSWVFVNIGNIRKNLRPFPKKILSPSNPTAEEPAMTTNWTANDGYEISPRFRRTVEERIARLEKDAENDEALAARLENGDHIRRQMRLVAVERAEALRMRLFLDRAQARLPRPLIEI